MFCHWGGISNSKVENRSISASFSWSPCVCILLMLHNLCMGELTQRFLCSFSACYCMGDPFFRERQQQPRFFFFRLKNQYVKKLFSVRWLKIFCYEVIFIFIRLFSWNMEALSECLWSSCYQLASSKKQPNRANIFLVAATFCGQK